MRKKSVFSIIFEKSIISKKILNRFSIAIDYFFFQSLIINAKNQTRFTNQEEKILIDYIYDCK